MKDSQLLGDKFKFMNNKNVLINPESATVRKLTPSHSVLVASRSLIERNNSEVKLKPLSHKTNIVVQAPAKDQLDDIITRKKLEMLNDLANGKVNSATLPHSPSSTPNIIPQVESRVIKSPEEPQ